jgi:hypothetical protein
MSAGTTGSSSQPRRRIPAVPTRASAPPGGQCYHNFGVTYLSMSNIRNIRSLIQT